MIRKDYFLFDGISSSDYGIFLNGAATADAPQREVTAQKVPGRSGDLLIEDGRFSNQQFMYRCAVVRDFEHRFACLKTALLQRQGYCRLEDTVHPEEYRMAAFLGPISPETIPFNRAGQFDLTFNCKPQRYLKRGEIPIALPAGGTARLMNPGFPALPLITVYGTGAGTLSVAGVAVNFLGNFSGPIVLDCDTQNAYFAGANKNTEIYAPTFPVLPAGECPINWSGGIERVEITPRWWTI